MSVAAILSPERIFIAGAEEDSIVDKSGALERLSHLFARATRTTRSPRSISREEILEVLIERERQQSTGVGGGVAVPHGALDGLEVQLGALLVLKRPIAFGSLDARPVSIVFGLLGPRGAAAQHLKLLARIARLLRDDAARARIASARDSEAAYAVVCDLERSP